jgi:hypothetical protein
MDDRPSSEMALAGILSHSSRRKIAVAMLTATLGGFMDIPQSLCTVACKPTITVKSIHFSGAQEMRRVWTAALIVTAPQCATSSGRFEIDFTRAKEHAPDLQFTEQFEWRAGEIKVSLDLWWDEVVTDYRIGFIAPCVCKDMQF